MAETDIVCISPIDGRELVRRPIMSEAAIDAAIKSAREAQKAWRNVSIAERVVKVSAFLDALLAMNQEVVPHTLRRRVPRGRGARALYDRDSAEKPAAHSGRR
jgi:acyl-CoA reductase-like NAD-dependent aldehyde dehydrogenase